MKRFKKMVLPVAIVMIAAVGAFATNSTKKTAMHDGYRYDELSETCVNTEIQCSDVQTSFICTDGSANQLRQINGTGCPDFLYKP
ncbi:DUF6520 family protein [Chryseobacterium lathyri]|uniref:Uncharacterized protein n=1 Tax=Chryseobacterium lathyri TaxID=395933 RepID=A0A511YEX7_9FLAO|nr:DUF6520 family protein [Chryseobacterium lathyri]GEN73750.1 hypothetical protein CLA01_38220 [Chryseobacterium lathyri]